MLIHDFNEKFNDLKAIEFPSWLTQPLLVDLSAVSEQWQQELCALQQDEVAKTIFKIKGPRWGSRGMRNEIPSLEYFGKAKTDNDKFSVILFGRMWV